MIHFLGGPPPPPPSGKGPPPQPSRAPPLASRTTPRTTGIKRINQEQTLEELHVILKQSTEMNEVDFLKLHQGIRMSCLEMYLSEQDFKNIFGLKREEFSKFPSFKKKAQRKEHGLL